MSSDFFVNTAGAEHRSDKLTALLALKIDGGEILSVVRDLSPTLTLADNQVIENLVPRTIVKLVLLPASGSRINVEIWLPDAEMWNGRFLALGNGGSAGLIHLGGLARNVNGGFAVATTDMGTAHDADSGVGNPEVWKDFGFRATHLMTISAKRIIQACFGKEAEYSYFIGSSTGGQQALQEAQRYPEDYDGIVADIPAHCRTPLHAYFLWNDQIMARCQFTEVQEAAIIAAGNEYMANREMPAIAGRFVSDPRCTQSDIEAVIKLVRQKDPTLTQAQADGLRDLFDGPKNSATGERIFCGIPFGSALKSAHGHLYLFKWVFGPDKDFQKLNFNEDIDTYTAALGPYLNAENADLSRFAKRGGKLLMMSGSTDPVVPYHASLDYYERVIEACGGLEPAQSFILFFIIPGMDHGPGPGINNLPSSLRLIMDWREKGIAPKVMVGKRIIDGRTELEMPLYPYPAKTQWSAETNSYFPMAGPRGGVDRIAERFRPPAEE